MERLQKADVQVFYIKGNHDAENPITGEIDLPACVHVFDGRGGKVQLSPEAWVHGVSFRDKHAPDSLLPKFGTPEPGVINIAMLHTSLAGTPGHDLYAPCAVADLVSSGFDYWALGHIHKRQIHAKVPWVVMPGNPQGRDIGEAGAKSATLLTIENGQITLEEIPTSSVEFRESTVSIAGLADDDEIRDALRTHLAAEAATVPDCAILRLTLTGATPRAWQLRRDRDVWAEVLTQLCAPDPARRYANAAEVAGDLNLILAGRSVRRANGVERRLAQARQISAVALGVLTVAAGIVWFQQTQRREAETRAAHEQSLRELGLDWSDAIR